jgi:hypothetical protein
MNNQMLAKVAAIITTLAETADGCPESTLYIFCDMNMDTWQRMRAVLVGSDLVKISGYWASLTPLGRTTADKINTALANRTQF